MPTKRTNVRQWIDQVNQQHWHTPDTEDIDNHHLQYVFTYGTLKKGFHNSGFLKDALFVSECVTVGGEYRLFDSGSGFPVATFNEEGVKRATEAHIHGELYLCSPEDIVRMDSLESNGYMYNRELHNVSNPEIQEEFLAWMYIGNPEYWANRCGRMELLPQNEQYGVYRWEK